MLVFEINKFKLYGNLLECIRDTHLGNLNTVHFALNFILNHFFGGGGGWVGGCIKTWCFRVRSQKTDDSKYTFRGIANIENCA